MTTLINVTYRQIYNRLKNQLPDWFGNQVYVPTPPPSGKTSTTVFNNLMWAYITTAYNGYLQLQYDFLQLRIGAYEIANDPNWPITIPANFPFVAGSPTIYYPLPIFPQNPIAFSDNLDLIAQDFFGDGLLRHAGEPDNAYRTRILSNVCRPKATRPAMLQALINLVTPAFAAASPNWSPLPLAYYPVIYEPWSASDNGVYNLDMPPTLAFNEIGCYGTGSQPYTCWITVFIPSAVGLGNIPGYSETGESVTWGAGFGDPSITPATDPIDIPPSYLGDQDLLSYFINENDIVTLINLTKVLGTVCNLTIIYVN